LRDIFEIPLPRGEELGEKVPSPFKGEGQACPCRARATARGEGMKRCLLE